MEIWKVVPDHKNHYISSLGRVRGPNGIKGKPSNKRDYDRISIKLEGRTTTRLVHRLVASAFIDNPLSLPQVNHKDGDKQNNHIENLEWCTLSHNMKHAVGNNLLVQKKGIDHKRTRPVIGVKKDGSVGVVLFGASQMSASGFNPCNIATSLTGGQKSHRGYFWEYASV